MNVNELTNILEEKFYKELECDPIFTLIKEQPDSLDGWEFYDYPLGFTRESIVEEVDMILDCVARSLIHQIYCKNPNKVKDSRSFINIDRIEIYIDMKPKIDLEFTTDIYRARCKYWARIIMKENGVENNPTI